MTRNFYSLSVAEALQAVAGDAETGLRQAEAKKRLAEYGLNQLKETKKISALALFCEQFKNFIVWILIGAALISGFLREWIDTAAILSIVILNALLGFIQEFRAEKSLAALKKLSSPTAKVIRNSQREIIPSSQLVPGDLIELEAGDNVPADCRLTYVSLNLAVLEASLTGESLPVEKTIRQLTEEAVPLAERANMVYLGTSIASGRARALVVGTGMKTELGKIAGLIQEIKEEATPLQKKIEQFGRVIVVACGALVAMVFGLELLRGGELLEVFLIAVSLAVAAIPEGLPAVVTIALALGVRRMVKRNVLIRKLPSVETLGSTTVICSDKTGTLTKNELTVREIFSDNIPEALKAGVLCNGASLTAEGKIIGDPTEGAILVAAAKQGLFKEQLEKEYQFVEEIPFDSVRKKMTIVRKARGKYYIYVKGAPDVMISDPAILKVNDQLASQALRVLAVAYKELTELPSQLTPETLENNLTFLGLVGMIDPPREEVKTAVLACKSAGIKTIMITGDHKNTAQAIARELGIDTVYSRVSPEDKIRIVHELRGRGEIVAMTGDGVNDAPALKESDIGIAMGITGTDVTKEVSDMVITDDNFASIVAAVEEGRGIYDNIRKFIHYLLSCNIGEVLVMFIASLIGWPVPLLPVQILWVNLVTDGLPALALGVDPLNPSIMQRPPRPTKESVITSSRAWLMSWQGLLIAICSLSAYAFVLFVEQEGVGRARTAAFIVLAVSQLFHAFNCRSNEESLFKLGVFSNPGLIAAFLVSFSLQVLIINLPLTQAIFKVESLGLFDWGLVLGFSSLPFWLMEIVKSIKRKQQNLN